MQTPRTLLVRSPSIRVRPQADDAPRPYRLGPLGTLGLAVWSGLVVGILELASKFVRRGIFGETAWLGRHQLNRHYLWMTPATSLAVFLLCGLGLAVLAWLLPKRVVRASALSLTFLAALALLLTIHTLLPIASLVLAAGIASWAAPYLEARAARIGRIASKSLAWLLGFMIVLTGFSFAREVWRENRALSGRPAPQQGAPNVLLIVLDATRADALSPYGARRDTTPHLTHLAKKGVTFDHARATAPWTLPSHASMFTGRWPHEFQVNSKKPLDDTYPTLAECLRRRGYATGGFVGNYAFGSAGYGLERGFSHYEDRPISIDDVLGSSALGRRLVPAVELIRDRWSRLVDGRGWVNSADPRYFTRPRTAEEISNSLLNWIAKQDDRPFFAFVNLYDAHAPYIAPASWKQHFGVAPENPADYDLLRYWEQDRHAWNPRRGPDGDKLTDRELALARDSYDDCVAYIDHQLGRLFGALDRKGILSNTLVIVTADHGEGFGEHGIFCHYATVHGPEINVPLFVSWPGRVPEGMRIADPVSLRSLPATVIDLLKLSDRSPFPGRSLARFWNPGAGSTRDDPNDLVLSELEELSVQALMSGTMVYIHHDDGVEQLFDIKYDPTEDNDLMGYPGRRPEAVPFREALARVYPIPTGAQ